jgi:hypothetical protein
MTTAPPQDALDVFLAGPELTEESILYTFFGQSETSQAAGRAYWARIHQRTTDRDPVTSEASKNAQVGAVYPWLQATEGEERFARLKGITQPTLILNGNHDALLPSYNSYVMAKHIPSSQLIIFPDSGHGSAYQYPGPVRRERRALPGLRRGLRVSPGAAGEGPPVPTRRSPQVPRPSARHLRDPPGHALAASLARRTAPSRRSWTRCGADKRGGWGLAARTTRNRALPGRTAERPAREAQQATRMRAPRARCGGGRDQRALPAARALGRSSLMPLSRAASR